MKNCKKTEAFEYTTIPSLFSGETALSRTLICKNKPNFENSRSILTRETKGSYTNFYPETRQKNKPKANPNKANLQHLFRGENLFKNPPLTITDGKCPLDTKPNFLTSRKNVCN